MDPLYGLSETLYFSLKALDGVSKVALTLGFVGVWVAVRNLRRSRRSEKASTFTMLRGAYYQNFRQLQDTIPDFDNPHTDLSYNLLSVNQKSILKQYWIQSFNEWFITNKVYDGDRLGLWKDFYRHAQLSALQLPILRDTIVDMFASNYSFGEYKEEFKAEIEAMYGDALPGSLTFTDLLHQFELKNPSISKDARDFGIEILNRVSEPSPKFREIGAELLSFDEDYFENKQGAAEWLACTLAYEAACRGDFGVGAVWVGKDFSILGTASNTVFTGKNTSEHAEMNLVDIFPVDQEIDPGTKVVSSLEPCPMCLSRLSMTNVEEIIYISPDEIGGMARSCHQMPPVWRDFLGNKKISESADKKLARIADTIFQLTLERNHRLGGR